MLGQITRNLEDVQSRLQPHAEFAAEWKYDGQRVQIHARMRDKATDGARQSGPFLPGAKSKGGLWVGEEKEVYVRLFSRHLEDSALFAVSGKLTLSVCSVTDKYPDILALVLHMITESAESANPIESFVMDAEVRFSSSPGFR